MIVDWATELSAKLGRPIDLILDKGLGALDFGAGSSVEIKDSRGMTTRVELAFAVIRPERNLAAVFSEHCGYLEFDLGEDSVVAEIREQIYVHRGGS